ncbi:MAG: hypothetical protein J0M34_04915 [Alphaproteobacteria bacterium]|nr:hypothetical protein [Alphaproteobacteria bacterium]
MPGIASGGGASALGALGKAGILFAVGVLTASPEPGIGGKEKVGACAYAGIHKPHARIVTNLRVFCINLNLLRMNADCMDELTAFFMQRTSFMLYHHLISMIMLLMLRNEHIVAMRLRHCG